MGMGHGVYKTTDPRGEIFEGNGRPFGQKARPGKMAPSFSAELEKAASEEFGKEDTQR